MKEDQQKGRQDDGRKVCRFRLGFMHGSREMDRALFLAPHSQELGLNLEEDGESVTNVGQGHG